MTDFELGADRLRPLARDAGEVDREKRRILAKAAQADQAVAVDVALADLEKAPAGREQGEALLEERPRQRIQHHVDAASLCCREHVVGEAERARVEHVGDAARPQVIALFGAACGRNDARPAAARDRDRRKPDAAGRRMDQHGLARLQARERAQRILGGRIGGRERRGRRKRKLLGNRNDECGWRHNMRGERAAGHRDHPASGEVLIAAFAGLDDHAGAFEAEMLPGGRILGIGRQQPGRRHDVAEIQSDRADLDQDLAGSRMQRPHLAQPQPIERSRARHRDAEGRRPRLGLPCRGGERQALLADRAETARQALVPAQRDQRLDIVAQHLVGEALDRHPLRIDTDHPRLHVGHLISRRAHEADDRREER